MTVQAINALNAADVFFVLDKGEAAEELIAIREEICRRFITHANYRVVKVPQPERDRASANYKAGVDAWHADKAALFETLIGQELAENECGAFLVWGDPALYDSTIRILHRILARGQTAFDYEVIPGITSAQALAAGHKIPLNRIGEPVELTTGRRIANRASIATAWCCSMPAPGLNALRDQDATIYWGAYLGTPDEVLITGKLKDVGGEILRVRERHAPQQGLDHGHLPAAARRERALEACLPQHGQRFDRRSSETRDRQVTRELRRKGEIERRGAGIEQCAHGRIRFRPICRSELRRRSGLSNDFHRGQLHRLCACDHDRLWRRAARRQRRERHRRLGGNRFDRSTCNHHRRGLGR